MFSLEFLNADGTTSPAGSYLDVARASPHSIVRVPAQPAPPAPEAGGAAGPAAPDRTNKRTNKRKIGAARRIERRERRKHEMSVFESMLGSSSEDSSSESEAEAGGSAAAPEAGGAAAAPARATVTARDVFGDTSSGSETEKSDAGPTWRDKIPEMLVLSGRTRAAPEKQGKYAPRLTADEHKLCVEKYEELCRFIGTGKRDIVKVKSLKADPSDKDHRHLGRIRVARGCAGDVIGVFDDQSDIVSYSDAKEVIMWVRREDVPKLPKSEYAKSGSKADKTPAVSRDVCGHGHRRTTHSSKVDPEDVSGSPCNFVTLFNKGIFPFVVEDLHSKVFEGQRLVGVYGVEIDGALYTYNKCWKVFRPGATGVVPAEFVPHVTSRYDTEGTDMCVCFLATHPLTIECGEEKVLIPSGLVSNATNGLEGTRITLNRVGHPIFGDTHPAILAALRAIAHASGGEWKNKEIPARPETPVMDYPPVRISASGLGQDIPLMEIRGSVVGSSLVFKVIDRRDSAQGIPSWVENGQEVDADHKISPPWEKTAGLDLDGSSAEEDPRAKADRIAKEKEARAAAVREEAERIVAEKAQRKKQRLEEARIRHEKRKAKFTGFDTETFANPETFDKLAEQAAEIGLGYGTERYGTDTADEASRRRAAEPGFFSDSTLPTDAERELLRQGGAAAAPPPLPPGVGVPPPPMGAPAQPQPFLRVEASPSPPGEDSVKEAGVVSDSGSESGDEGGEEEAAAAPALPEGGEAGKEEGPVPMEEGGEPGSAAAPALPEGGEAGEEEGPPSSSEPDSDSSEPDSDSSEPDSDSDSEEEEEKEGTEPMDEGGAAGEEAGPAAAPAPPEGGEAGEEAGPAAAPAPPEGGEAGEEAGPAAPPPPPPTPEPRRPKRNARAPDRLGWEPAPKRARTGRK